MPKEHFYYEDSWPYPQPHPERLGGRPVISHAPVPEGEGWTPLPHSSARDRQLSYKALGLLMELLSYPPGWETSIDKMHTINKAKGGNREGRDSMRQAMQELEREGYVTRHRKQRDDGKFETVVTAHNTPVAPDRRTEYQASVGQSSVNQPSVDQASLRTRATNTERKTEEQHHTALAEARTAAAKAAADEVIDKRFHDLCADVDAMKPDRRRHLLLKFERKRPSIYRKCRNKAIDRVNDQKPEAFGEIWSADGIDRLSLKFALQHYAPDDEFGDWPVWITPPRREGSA